MYRKLTFVLAALALAACSDVPTVPRTMSPQKPNLSVSSSSPVVANDVTYGMLHGSFRIYNPAVTSVSSGFFMHDTAYVHHGATLGLTANWAVGPVTNTGYCPGCIIETYAAWVSPAATNGATPRNIGLWEGATPCIGCVYTFQQAANPFSWGTKAPTVDGIYYIGVGGSLDYQFNWWVEGGMGSPTAGPSTQPAASFLVVDDDTPPVVAYSGNAGTYTVDQTVAITCSATDATSGVTSSTCADVNGAAYSFGLGAHTYSATATDKLGNVGTGSTSFNVTVTYASLCNLTTSFESNAGIANSLCAKLDAAAAAAARGQSKTAANVVQAYENAVSAQSGKSISAANATILEGLAAAL